MNRAIDWKTLAKSVVLLGAIGATVPAAAHHSTAMYDYAKSQTLTGTVKEFQWTNPHMFIKLLASDAQGKEVQWNVECGTVNINVEGKALPLTAEPAKTYGENKAKFETGDLSFDPTARCISPGLPRILYLPYAFEIIHRPKKITYLFEWN